MLTEIVKRAMVEPVCDIGQLTATEKRELNAAVKRGYLSKGRGGPFPRIKTMYAHPEFDFEADRRREVAEAMRISEWESRHDYSQRGKCLNLNCSHTQQLTIRKEQR
jgi:hypothetical protein